MRKKKVLVLSVMIMLALGSVAYAKSGMTENITTYMKGEGSSISSFSGGNGTEGNPYLISNVTQLQNMTANVTAHYELANDIDASNTTEWNGGAGFKPVGNNTEYFTGSFDGQNYTITDLYINRSSVNYVGLFGYTDAGAEVSDVGLVDANITGSSSVGGLVGINGYDGTVNNSYATGDVNGTNGDVGGLVGTNSGTVNNSYAGGNVSGGGTIGGLVGRNGYDSMVNNSYATGDVNGTSWDTGGLVGYNEGTVDYSYATGNVNGDSPVGGLVGTNYGIVNHSYAAGDVNGTDYVGGLVGVSDYYTTISHSYATGNVSGNSDVGGLLGMSYDSSVSNSYANTNVSGGSNVGGLVGKHGGKVSNTYAVGTVNGTKDFGGLVGNNTEGHVISSFYHEDMPECDAYGSGSWPLSDAGFNSISTFESAGWDIEMVNTTRDRPYLSWEEGENSSDWFIQETEKTYNLTIQTEGGGSTDPSVGTHVYYEHGKIIIEAISDDLSEYYFVNWTGDVESDEKVINLTMDQDKTVTANFEAVDTDIYTWEHLYNVRYYLSGNFTLMNDLDETTEGYEEYVNTEEGWDPIGDYNNEEDVEFIGTFDGNGYEIRDLYINRSGEQYVGLFGYIDDGSKVSNVGLVDANVSGGENIGGLVGSINGGTVENSYVTGNLSSTSGSGCLGGLVGVNSDTVNNSYAAVYVNGTADVGGLVASNYGTVTNSYATGDLKGGASVGGLIGDNDGSVFNSYATANLSDYPDHYTYLGGLIGINSGPLSNSYATGTVTGDDDVGGLVGLNYNTVSNTYARGNVSGNSEVGGLVGENSGTVNTSYATGEVSGNTDVGGLVGLNDGGTVSNSFWDNQTSGQTTSDGGTGKNTTEMKTQSTFTDAGWDFDNTWWMIEDETYPLLSWQPKNTTDIELTAGGLADGWNFLSFDLKPVDSDLTAILDDIEYGIAGSYDKVMYYNASADEWRTFTPDRASHYNSLHTWDRTMGIWIHMTSNATLTIAGEAPSSTNITLEPGWNIVGYPSETDRIAADVLPPEVTKIGTFDKYAEYNIDYIYDMSTEVLVTGRGYWMYNDADYIVEWSVTYRI
ncbi:MAG: GLUG motif-containing protein [Thermoplasmata archaeon]